MSNKESEYEKVLFKYHSDVLDEETVETMWAITIDKSKGIFKLDNIPFYGPNIAPGDTFFAEFSEEEQMLTFKEIKDYSENSVVLVSIAKEGMSKEPLRDEFKILGCESEGLNDSYFTMEIPKSANYKEIKLRLDGYEENKVLFYAEPCLSSKHQLDLAK